MVAPFPWLLTAQLKLSSHFNCKELFFFLAVMIPALAGFSTTSDKVSNCLLVFFTAFFSLGFSFFNWFHNRQAVMHADEISPFWRGVSLKVVSSIFIFSVVSVSSATTVLAYGPLITSFFDSTFKSKDYRSSFASFSVVLLNLSFDFFLILTSENKFLGFFMLFLGLVGFAIQAFLSSDLNSTDKKSHVNYRLVSDCSDLVFSGISSYFIWSEFNLTNGIVFGLCCSCSILTRFVAEVGGLKISRGLMFCQMATTTTSLFNIEKENCKNPRISIIVGLLNLTALFFCSRRSYSVPEAAFITLDHDGTRIENELEEGVLGENELVEPELDARRARKRMVRKPHFLLL